uniref:Uncharacterized protein n=1 Tax=Arundo donax TaxID=35708 RepID=A0A0A9TJR9_ARUDO
MPPRRRRSPPLAALSHHPRAPPERQPPPQELPRPSPARLPSSLTHGARRPCRRHGGRRRRLSGLCPPYHGPAAPLMQREAPCPSAQRKKPVGRGWSAPTATPPHVPPPQGPFAPVPATIGAPSSENNATEDDACQVFDEMAPSANSFVDLMMNENVGIDDFPLT